MKSVPTCTYRKIAKKRGESYTLSAAGHVSKAAHCQCSPPKMAAEPRPGLPPSQLPVPGLSMAQSRYSSSSSSHSSLLSFSWIILPFPASTPLSSLVQLCVCLSHCLPPHPKPRLRADKARILLREAQEVQERLWPQNINNFLPHCSRIKSIFPLWISNFLKYLISKAGGGRTPWKDRSTSEKRNPSLGWGISAKWAKRPGFFLTVHATRCKRIYLLSKIFPYYILSNFPLKTNSACQKAPGVPQAPEARMGHLRHLSSSFKRESQTSLF